MRIALVRHGQTDWNVADLLQGSSDVPLNAVGRAQAAEAARRLEDQVWTSIVTSPSVRAAETARIIAEHLGLAPASIDAGLVERDYGQAEGLTRAQATERFGTDWPGEETYEALEERAVEAVDRVAREHLGDELIIVTHGTFIRSFTDMVTGLVTVKPDNAGSVRFVGEPGAWIPESDIVLAPEGGAVGGTP